ncbi:prepilin-type N-terminal cleavage/methylation domain-containing protein [Verrucomicrobia bacterium S94]|nr:prepilin-type N-terminal cleavage/methylation domain-containing protein [Verrucomicrobia bacterium S94]
MNRFSREPDDFRGDCNGFSLLEVLVALVVFAVGVTGMLTALGYNLRDISYTEDHAMAVRIASREMNALRRLTYVPDSESGGEEGRFSWRITVEERDVDTLPGMDGDDESQTDALVPCEMEVVVSWSEDAEGEAVHKVKLNGIELFEDE